MIGTRAERMYPGTLVARHLDGTYRALCPQRRSFFVALFAIVAFGFLLTFGCYLTDRARKPAR
jgi:hypothetical protein